MKQIGFNGFFFILEERIPALREGGGGGGSWCVGAEEKVNIDTHEAYGCLIRPLPSDSSETDVDACTSAHLETNDCQWGGCF